MQQTLYAIADVVLSTYQEISDITLSLQERPVPARSISSRAGVENPDDLFVALEEPVGVVEVTVERDADRSPLPRPSRRHSVLDRFQFQSGQQLLNAGRSVFTIASSCASCSSSCADSSLNTAYD